MHVTANGIMSFFLSLSSIPLCVCVCVRACVYIFIHSSVDGHLDCFHILAVANSASVKIAVHVSF